MNASICEDTHDEEGFIFVLHAELHLVEKPLQNAREVGRSCESSVMHSFVIHSESTHRTLHLNFLNERKVVISNAIVSQVPALHVFSLVF